MLETWFQCQIYDVDANISLVVSIQFQNQIDGMHIANCFHLGLIQVDFQ